ncbi:RNA ligase family protein [Streptomyces sp. NPDC050485]|uniref:ATP-dependent DNA ligase n=1 Tax=Streptomyces sp. NPDC050485 TaxID=3365617 RepID=UPI003797CEAC
MPLPLPITVVRPTPVPEVPTGPCWQYTVKLDGYRAVTLRTNEGVLLHSRSGRGFGNEFPELAEPLRALPAGVVLDGEICAAYADGRMEFTALARTAAWRRSHGVAVSLTAFDVLALTDPGNPAGDARDVRALPLTERWELLNEVLTGTSVRPVLATSDRDTALTWARDLAALGVEGIVARRWDAPYSPRLRGAWVKWRSNDTVDAPVLAVLGPVHRPRAVRVLLDGEPVVTTPRLDAVHASQVAHAVPGRLLPRETTSGPPAAAGEQPVAQGLVAEVRVTTGRHPAVRLVRLRPAD